MADMPETDDVDDTTPSPEYSLVAFIDILGLSNKIRDDFTSAARVLNAFADVLGPLVDARRLQLHRLKVISFSDATILVLPVDDPIGITASKPTIIQFGTLLSSLMSECLINDPPVPLRGGISIGNVITGTSTPIRNRSFVSGLALLEAYEYEEEQNWAGISFCPIRDMYRQRNCHKATSILRETSPPLALEYDVPTKRFNTEDCQEELGNSVTSAVCWDYEMIDDIETALNELAAAVHESATKRLYTNALDLLNEQRRRI